MFTIIYGLLNIIDKSVNQPFYSISVNFRINLFIMVHSAAEKKQKKKVKIPYERTLLAQICNSIQN